MDDRERRATGEARGGVSSKLGSVLFITTEEVEADDSGQRWCFACSRWLSKQVATSDH